MKSRCLFGHAWNEWRLAVAWQGLFVRRCERCLKLGFLYRESPSRVDDDLHLV